MNDDDPRFALGPTDRPALIDREVQARMPRADPDTAARVAAAEVTRRTGIETRSPQSRQGHTRDTNQLSLFQARDSRGRFARPSRDYPPITRGRNEGRQR